MLGALFHSDEFWVAIAFVLFVVLAWRPIGRKITALLDARAGAIKSEIDEAQRLKEEAQRALAEYQLKQRDALKEAEAIVAHARAEAERAAERAAQEIAAALERRQRQALENIALEEAKALAEVRNAAVDVAIAATRDIFARDLDAGRRNQLVDQAIAALPQALH